jgi:hypothetical protein
MRADRRAWPGVALALVLASGWAATAAPRPKVEWSIVTNQGRTQLMGTIDESEVDAELWARCRPDGMIDVGMGAESHVGKGKGEKVALTLTSAGQSVTIAGVSRESANVEMTGGIELQARLKPDDKLFAILATGQPITVTGPIETLKWEVRGLKVKVAQFLRSCARQKK